jgi:hypothetical protein
MEKKSTNGACSDQSRNSPNSRQMFKSPLTALAQIRVGIPLIADRCFCTGQCIFKHTNYIIFTFYHFSDMPEADRAKEESRLKEVSEKFVAALARIKADKSKFGI